MKNSFLKLNYTQELQVLAKQTNKYTSRLFSDSMPLSHVIKSCYISIHLLMLGNQDENMGQRGQHEISYFQTVLQKLLQQKPHSLCNISSVNTDKRETSLKRQREVQSAMTNFQQTLWRSQISSKCVISSMLVPGIGPQHRDVKKRKKI